MINYFHGFVDNGSLGSEAHPDLECDIWWWGWYIQRRAALDKGIWLAKDDQPVPIREMSVEHLNGAIHLLRTILNNKPIPDEQESFCRTAIPILETAVKAKMFAT